MSDFLLHLNIRLYIEGETLHQQNNDSKKTYSQALTPIHRPLHTTTLLEAISHTLRTTTSTYMLLLSLI